jgi:hypothetical protein
VRVLYRGSKRGVERVLCQEEDIGDREEAVLKGIFKSQEGASREGIRSRGGSRR